MCNVMTQRQQWETVSLHRASQKLCRNFQRLNANEPYSNGPLYEQIYFGLCEQPTNTLEYLHSAPSAEKPDTLHRHHMLYLEFSLVFISHLGIRLLSCWVECWSSASCVCSPISLPSIFLFCNRLAHNIHFLFRSVDCGTSCASCQCTHENRVWPNILVVSLYLLICFHRFVNLQQPPADECIFHRVQTTSVPYFLSNHCILCRYLCCGWKMD